jgi:spore coat protein U-like protein
LAVALLASAASRAATDTDTLIVTATVLSGCALTGGALDFGEYVSGQPDALDAVGQISFASCTGELVFELDGGVSGSVNDRRMSGGGGRLRYQLYRNATRTAVWGVGADAQRVQIVGTQSGRVDVFGRIPPGQVVPAGAYTDTVNITLTF